jgi:hypothetical protein
MDTSEMLRLLKIERECVMRANTCGRDCANCDLVQDDDILIDMYNSVIDLICKENQHDR